MPELSIVIPTYNSEKALGPLLESIFSQEFEDFEVIVVDDSSRDLTEEVARRFNVRFLKLDRNRGPSYARNLGAREAASENLVFFDSDVVLKQGVLRKFRDWLSNGRAKAVIGLYDAQPLNPGIVPLYKAMQEQVWFDEIKGDRVTTFTPSVGAVKRHLFLRLGGFDDSYRGAEVEDYKLSRRLLEEAQIYLDRTIRVGHNFPNLRKLVRSYIRRCYLWAQIFFSNPRFDNNTTTPRQAATVILYSLVLLSAAACIVNAIFLWPASICLLWAIFLDRRFVSYAYLRKGPSFTFFVIWMNLFLSPIIVFSAIAGATCCLFKKER